MANGRDPETVSLRDWLDAGYVMLVDGADSTARQLLDDLFGSETVEDMERGFADLRAEVQHRNDQARKAETEHRRKTGAPVHARRLPAKVLEDALAEWEEITGADPVDAPEGEPGEPV